MLPVPFLERITSSSVIKSFETGSERRKSVRVPMSYKGEFLTVDHDRIGDVCTVRLKDASVTGVGLLMPVRTKMTQEFVLGMCPKGHGTHWALCKVRRAEVFDGICLVIGASWERVLYPGQEIQPGMRVSSLLWLDVAGEEVVEDPYLEQGESGRMPPVVRKR
jgi:hypothetical protein